MQGWIKLHRKIQEHAFFQEKRVFSKFEAWIDLLLMANHKDNKVLLGNELIHVEKGSFITSELKLMDRWGWSKTKVRAFLKLLEQDEMITKKSDKKKTTLSICNYCIYQHSETTEKPQKNHEQTTERPQKDTNKNVKNVKNEKKENIPYTKIIDYLNEKAGKSFSAQTKKTKDFIAARWNEGHDFDDFVAVIDHFSSAWKGVIFSDGTPAEKYLQPSTLFNGKFDERVNEAKMAMPDQEQTERKYSPDAYAWAGKVVELREKLEKAKTKDEKERLEIELEQLENERHLYG